MRQTRIKCPLCKSKSIIIQEHIVCIGEWYQENGILSNEAINFPSDYFKLTAKCNCGHEWRIRKAIQITDIIEEAPNETN